MKKEDVEALLGRAVVVDVLNNHNGKLRFGDVVLGAASDAAAFLLEKKNVATREQIAFKVAMIAPVVPEPVVDAKAMEAFGDQRWAEGRDAGVDHVFGILSAALHNPTWHAADGSGTWEGDVHGTLANILHAAGVIDPGTGALLLAAAARPTATEAIDRHVAESELIIAARSVVVPAGHIAVSARSEKGRWRGGRFYTRVPTIIALNAISEDQLALMAGDAELIVEPQANEPEASAPLQR